MYRLSVKDSGHWSKTKFTWHRNAFNLNHMFKLMCSTNIFSLWQVIVLRWGLSLIDLSVRRYEKINARFGRILFLSFSLFIWQDVLFMCLIAFSETITENKCQSFAPLAFSFTKKTAFESINCDAPVTAFWYGTIKMCRAQHQK